jgi:hypothetical protein
MKYKSKKNLTETSAFKESMKLVNKSKNMNADINYRLQKLIESLKMMQLNKFQFHEKVYN